MAQNLTRASEISLADLFTQATTADQRNKQQAQRKFLNSIKSASLQDLEALYAMWFATPQLKKSQKFCKILLRKHANLQIGEVQQDDATPKKRKAAPLGLMTPKQLESIKRLCLSIGLESAFTNKKPIDSFQVFNLTKKYLTGKSRGQLTIDDLCMHFALLLNREAAYVRDCVKQTFKQFMGETSEKFLNDLCEVVLNGQTTQEVPEEVEGDDEELENGQLETVLSDPTSTNVDPLQAQNFVLRLTDLIEMLFKKSVSQQVIMKVFETFFMLLKRTLAAKQKSPGIIGRSLAILNKLPKSKGVVQESEEQNNEDPQNNSDSQQNSSNPAELAKSLMKFISVKPEVADQLYKPFKFLMKQLTHEQQSEIVRGILLTFFRKKSSKIKISFLKKLMGDVEIDESIIELLLQTAKDVKPVNGKYNALELLKNTLKRGKVQQKAADSLCKLANSALKSSLKHRHKQTLIKQTLICLLKIVQKNHDISLQKFLRKSQAKIEEFNGLKGIIGQLKKKVPQA